MRKIDEIYQKKYGENYSTGDMFKSIRIGDLTEYKCVEELTGWKGKTIKGVYNENDKEVFVVFTDKTYSHITSDDDNIYVYDEEYGGDITFLVDYAMKDGKMEYYPTRLCDLLEIDSQYVVDMFHELADADDEAEYDDEYQRYCELHKKYAERYEREHNETNG